MLIYSDSVHSRPRAVLEVRWDSPHPLGELTLDIKRRLVCYYLVKGRSSSNPLEQLAA